MSEARDRIFNAAVTEFAENGYEKASTNEMAKKYGVSKGLIFHYFKSKKALYLDVVEHFIWKYAEEYSAAMDDFPKECFEFIRAASIYKMNRYHKYPEAHSIFIDAYKIISSGIMPELDAIYEEFREVMRKKVYAIIDTSYFIDDGDSKAILEYTMGVMEGIGNRWLLKYRNNIEAAFEHIDEFTEKIDAVMEYVKYGVYKR